LRAVVCGALKVIKTFKEKTGMVIDE